MCVLGCHCCQRASDSVFIDDFRLEPETGEGELKCSNLGLLRLNHPFQDLRQVPCTFSSPAIIHRLSCQATVLPFQVSDPSVPCSLPICRIPSISLLNALCTGSDLPLLLVHCAGEIVLSNIDPSRANFSFSLTELIRRPTATLTSALIVNLLLSQALTADTLTSLKCTLIILIRFPELF